MSIKNILQIIGKTADKNAPTILAGLAGVGVVITTILAAEGGIKAYKVIKEEEEKKELSMPEKIVKAAPEYIPAVISGGLTIAAILMSNHVNKKRILALTGALAMTTEKMTSYQDKVKALLGEKTDKKVVDEVNKEKVSGMNTSDMTIIPGSGNMLCMDSITGQTFYGDVNHIDAAVNKLNKMLLHDQWVSLNSLLWEISDGHLRNSQMGDLLGWCVDKCSIEVHYTSCLTMDNVPCLCVNYVTLPSEIRWN